MIAKVICMKVYLNKCKLDELFSFYLHLNDLIYFKLIAVRTATFIQLLLLNNSKDNINA